MGLTIVALAAAPGLSAAQGTTDLYYQRAVMQAADEKCGLFAPEVAQALGSAAAQARGAALRAGVSLAQIRTLQRDAAARAAGTDCASPALATDAQRLRSAFAGFIRIGRLSYPGDVAGWQADRWGRMSAWRLKQETRFGGDELSFGLAGHDRAVALVAVASLADGERPYGARLIMRDVARTPGPYLDRWTGGPTSGLPLPQRLPPAAGRTVFVAEVRAPAGRDLLERDQRAGWAFRFPAAAARALAGLDPREAVALDFLFPDGAPRRAYVEVGDFAAGAAFIQASLR